MGCTEDAYLPADQAAAALIDRAFAKAVALRHGYVGQEHLVAAVAESRDPAVVAVLETLGVSGGELIARLERYLQPAETPATATPGWSPRAVRAINMARRWAVDGPPGAAQLVLGVIADGEGLGASAFAHAGLGLVAARQRLAGAS